MAGEDGAGEKAKGGGRGHMGRWKEEQAAEHQGWCFSVCLL